MKIGRIFPYRYKPLIKVKSSSGEIASNLAIMSERESIIRRYKIILDTDNRYFGGHDRNHSDVELQTQALQHDDRQHSFVVKRVSNFLYLNCKPALFITL